MTEHPLRLVREDAIATMELYLKFAHQSPDCGWGILAAHHNQQLQQLLDDMKSKQVVPPASLP